MDELSDRSLASRMRAACSSQHSTQVRTRIFNCSGNSLMEIYRKNASYMIVVGGKNILNTKTDFIYLNVSNCFDFETNYFYFNYVLNAKFLF